VLRGGGADGDAALLLGWTWALDRVGETARGLGAALVVGGGR
jgi:hypothetical protein